MSLANIPKFVFGGTDLVLEWPSRPWPRSVRAIGGDIASDADVRASYIVRRDELLTVTLRFSEDQWPEIESLIEFGQSGSVFLWYPDADVNEAFSVILDSPAINTEFAPAPDDAYPKVLTLDITLISPSWAGLAVFDPRTPIPPDSSDGGSDGGAGEPNNGGVQILSFAENTTVHIVGTATFLVVAGGGRSNNENGGGGGGVALVEVTDVDLTYALFVGGPGEQSAVNVDGFPLTTAFEGTGPGPELGGGSGGPTSHNAGGGGGVGGGGGSASGGGGGGGAGGDGETAQINSDALFAQAGHGGPGLPVTFHNVVIGVFGGGGGGGTAITGGGSAAIGGGGSGGGGNGGSGSAPGSPGSDGLGGGAGGSPANASFPQLGGAGIIKILFLETEAVVTIL